MAINNISRDYCKISVIRLGSVSGCSEKESAEIVSAAFENGVNYFDMAALDNKAFPSYGAVLSSVRNQIHFGIDQDADLGACEKNGSLAFLMDMKKQGAVRHIGLSSHTPALAQTVLDMGIVETLMFSINPGCDYHQGEFANGSMDERMAL